MALATDLQLLTPHAAVLAGLAAAVLYVGARVVYLLFFHPLAKYPGPKLAAVTDLWHVWTFVNDRQCFTLNDLHRKHGDVVRVGPNELSFGTWQAYQDIHGHVVKGKGRFLKTEFYDNGDPNPRITTVRDPEIHARQRRTLSHAFSAKSLRDQEDVIQKYTTMFVDQIARLGEGGKKALNMSDTFNWLTFDIIGDLAFAEPFGAIETGATHFWIALVFDSILARQMANLLRTSALRRLLFSPFLPRGGAASLARHQALTVAKARRRLALGDTGRDDFFSHMLRRGGGPGGATMMSETEMVNQAFSLILAGSETTATTLAAATWHLLRRPACLARLQAEVRAAFPGRGGGIITGDACAPARLPYLHAVLEESLRLFPPVIFPLPRHVAPEGAVVDGRAVPGGVTVSVEPLTMTRDPRCWREPDAFRPERWLDEDHDDAEGRERGKKDERRASQPFSLGPRGCLGVNLAYLELRVALARLAWEYDWELVAGPEDWLREAKVRILWKKPDLWVKYHPRAVA